MKSPASATLWCCAFLGVGFVAILVGQVPDGKTSASDPWKDAKFMDELGYVICMQDGGSISPRMKVFKQKYPQYDLFPVLKRIIDERLTSEDSEFEGRGAICGLAGLDDPRVIPLLRTLMSVPPRGENEEVPREDWSRFAVEATLDMEAKELYPVIHEHLRESRSFWELGYLLFILTIYPRPEFEDDLIALEKSPCRRLLVELPKALDAVRKARAMVAPPNGGGPATTVPTPQAPLPASANPASGSDSSLQRKTEGQPPERIALIAALVVAGATLVAWILFRRRPPAR